MKKLTAISILLVLLSTAAFAQLKVGFSSNIWTDAVFFEKATGDMADADQVKGAFNIFSGNNLNANEVRLSLTYTLPNAEALLTIKGDALVARGSGSTATAGTTYYKPVYQMKQATGLDSGGHSIPLFDTDGNPVMIVDPDATAIDHWEAVTVGGSSSTSPLLGNGANFQDILNQAFGDWYIKGHAWVFEGYIGNTDQRGVVEELTNFSDFVGGKLEHFGVVKFPFLVPIPLKSTDGSWYFKDSVNGKLFSGNDFVKMAGVGTTDTNNLKWGSAYTSLGINLGPLSIPLVVEVGSNAAFAGFKDAIDLNSTIQNGSDPSTSADSISAAFRVSGKKIADFISFDVVYRIQGVDPNTRLQFNNKTNDVITYGYNNSTPDAQVGGQWDNEFGLYAGIDLFKGFQISAGYTAAFTTDEQARQTFSSTGVGDYDNATVEFVNPVFSGIDLRLKFTGIDKLAIALTNNLSFAWQKGEDYVRPESATGGRIVQPMGWYLPPWGETTATGTANGGRSQKTPGMDSFQGYYGAYFSGVPNPLNLPSSPDRSFVQTLSNGAGNMWNGDQSDSWFALHNSLGVSYDITDRASVNVSMTNRLGVYEFIAVKDKETAKWTTDNFQIGVNGNYAFNSNISFAAGLNVSIWQMEQVVQTTSTTPPQGFRGDRDTRNPSESGTTRTETGKIGEVRLALPIQFKVTF